MSVQPQTNVDNLQNVAAPIIVQEFSLLENIREENILVSFNTVTIESCKSICIRDPQNKRICIVDVLNGMSVVSLPIICEFSVVNPVNRTVAVLIKSNCFTTVPGNELLPATVSSKYIQLFDIDLKAPIKNVFIKNDEDIIFTKWISPNTLGFVTYNSVYHWNVENGEPEKVFDRHVNLKGTQIINYRTDNSQKWCVLVALSGQNNQVLGCMQLYSVERRCSQFIEGHAACFARFLIEDNVDFTTLFCFVHKNCKTNTMKLHIVEVVKQQAGNSAVNKKGYQKKGVDLFIPPSCQNDFPVAIQVGDKYSLLYIITMFCYLYVFDIESGTCIYMNKITTDPIFSTAPFDVTGGVICVNKKGSVLVIDIDKTNILYYINSVLQNKDLAYTMARRDPSFKNSKLIFMEKFHQLYMNGRHSEAVRIAVTAPNEELRTEYVLQQLLQIDRTNHGVPNPNNIHARQPPRPSPILEYFGMLLDSGKKLNRHESIELCRRAVHQNKKQLIEKWLKDDKITYSEELGDLVFPCDKILALSVFLRANVPDKVIQCFIETKQFNKIVLYCKKINYIPDFINVLKEVIKSDIAGRPADNNLAFIDSKPVENSLPENSVAFAKTILEEHVDGSAERKECMQVIVNLFTGHNMVKECTAFLLDALKNDRPEDCELQTKLLEINILSGEIKVADAILSNKLFSHYNKHYIGQLYEKQGLMERALRHYTDLYDMKRILVQSTDLDKEFVVEYFNNLSAEDALECMKTMLAMNVCQNLPVCVKICTKYYKQLTIEAVMELFDCFKCYEGLYHFIGSVIIENPSLHDIDDVIHFKYIHAACKIGKIKEVERVCREYNFNNPEKVKNYLKEIKLSDQLPLIIICDRYNYVGDLVRYLYRNGLQKYIEIYVRRVNPLRLPDVVGTLLDVDCSEENVKSLIDTVNIGHFPIDRLVEEVEKRNRLRLLTPWLETRVTEGCTDEAVHNAMGKIYIDTNNNAERFLKENPYYDSIAIGKYCEKRDPHMACMAYERGKCDNEFMRLCYENNLFKLAARYLVRRCDPVLWNRVLVTDLAAAHDETSTRNRKQLMDQVIQIVSSETHDTEEVSVTVKAFMSADLPNELIEILEKIVLDNSIFSSHKNLQNLLLLTAIKCDKKRLTDYISRLDNYDTKDVAVICVNDHLYEEAFMIYKKFGYNEMAIQVLIEYLENLDRACEFAECCNDTAVWSLLGKAQLHHNFIKGSIDSFIRADDPSSYVVVVEAAQRTDSWVDLVRYLQMAYKKIHDTFVESELIYAYAKTNSLADLEEFISVPNNADLLKIGDRCFEMEMYEAAKILYNNISNYAKLSIALAKLKEFRDAVDNARKANCTDTWKEICFICLDNDENRLAQMCALNIVVHPDELQCVIEYYENLGRFNEVLDLLEAALGLERTHMGIFTELAILYAKYRPDKMKEHAELFWSRLNIPKVLKAADEAHLWGVATFLSHKYEDYDSAVIKIMDHPTESWRENHFKDIVTRVSNCELYYKAIRFYYVYKPLLLNDLLTVLSTRLDHTKAIKIFNELNCLGLVKVYLLSVQSINNKSINEVVNDLLIEEEDYFALKNSIDLYENFDNIVLAQKLEKHELIEFRRISAYLYRKSYRWIKSIDICKQEKLYKDAMKYAADSKNPAISEELLSWFLRNDLKDYSTALLFQCYELLRPDVVLELSWKHGISDYAMPYLIQVANEYIHKIDKLETDFAEFRETIDLIYKNGEKQQLLKPKDGGSQLMLTANLSARP